MKKKTDKKPKFDREGYQANMTTLNGEPLPEKMRVLTALEQRALGIPTPEELAGKSPQTKITLAIDDDALAFFKNEAKRLGTSYQRMMRNLIAVYARRAG